MSFVVRSFAQRFSRSRGDKHDALYGSLGLQRAIIQVKTRHAATNEPTAVTFQRKKIANSVEPAHAKRRGALWQEIEDLQKPSLLVLVKTTDDAKCPHSPRTRPGSRR